MKKLYLHMGLNKTATTSFQKTCNHNIKYLIKQSYLYPVLKMKHLGKQFINHNDFFKSFFRDTSKNTILYMQRKKIDINLYHKDNLSVLDACFNTNNKIILSGENIPEINDDKLIEFKKYLENYNFDIIPIIIVRPPYEFACSKFQQELKMGLQYSSFNNNILQIKKIKQVFPSAQFYPFRETCKHKDGAIGFLFDKMGVDYTDFEFINSNEGMSNTITRVMAELNRYELRSKDDQKKIDFISLKKYDSKSFVGKYLMTETEFASVKDQFDEVNTYFKEHLGEEFLDKEIKFVEEDNDTIKLCKGLITELKQVEAQKNKREREKFRKEISVLEEKILRLKSSKKNNILQNEDVLQNEEVLQRKHEQTLFVRKYLEKYKYVLNNVPLIKINDQYKNCIWQM